MNAIVVEEVRHPREQHAAKFRFNLKAIVANARRRQSLSGYKVVSFAKTKPAAERLSQQLAQLQTSVNTEITKGGELLIAVSRVASAKQDGSDEDASALRSFERSRDNTVCATCDRAVAELHFALGDAVEAKDLLAKVRSASWPVLRNVGEGG